MKIRIINTKTEERVIFNPIVLMNLVKNSRLPKDFCPALLLVAMERRGMNIVSPNPSKKPIKKLIMAYP